MTSKNGKNIIALKPVVKYYAWGVRGMDSRVARFALESKAIKDVDPDAPYAELWIGTHPKGPSTLERGESLREAIGEELPFLLKILSAGKALSIQAHPDKETAELLHMENPEAYGDTNHKPEMAIALTPFEAMCGFRRLEEISSLIKKYPEFAACISPEAKLKVFLSPNEETPQKEALQEMFASFMSCDPEVAKENLDHLVLRFRALETSLNLHPHNEPAWERKCVRAILRLAQQFPGDPAAMAPLFLNYLTIAPGESFFMAPNEPHAYVAGEIIECMACSDNVVRAGLTPKFKDIDSLVGMLTYNMGGPSIDAGRYEAESPEITRYTPSVPEFEVVVANIDPGKAITIENPSTPSVMIVVEGSGRVDGEVTSQGRSYYWPSESGALKIEVPESKRGPLKLAIAHKNQSLNEPTAMIPSDFFQQSSLYRVGPPSSPTPYCLGNKTVAAPTTLSRSPTEVSEFALGIPDSPPHLIL